MEHFFENFLRNLLTRNENGAIIMAEGTKSERKQAK